MFFRTYTHDRDFCIISTLYYGTKGNNVNEFTIYRWREREHIIRDQLYIKLTCSTILVLSSEISKTHRKYHRQLWCSSVLRVVVREA